MNEAIPNTRRGYKKKYVLTTKHKSQRSSSCCAECKISGSRDSPNHTTLGRRRPEHFIHLKTKSGGNLKAVMTKFINTEALICNK